MELLICIPTFNGDINAHTAHALAESLSYLREQGIKANLHFETGNPYIPIARNKCVDAFMKSTATHLMFVDQDVVFNGKDIYKLALRDVDIIGGIYPFKSDEESYPVTIYTNDDRTPVVIDGMISAKTIPTGFMLVKRIVFEKMLFKVHGYHRDCPLFFDTGMNMNDGVWYGEDVFFCNKWIASGGKIFIEPDISFLHIANQKIFSGNYHEFMMKQPKPKQG